MDFKRLRYALAVADEGNFVRAAERVSISQPALSRAVQTLEEELGFLLFDRGNRNVAVTVAGAAFFNHARRLLFDVRNMEHDLALLRNGDSGQVAFGIGPLHSGALLPRMLRQVRADQPGITLSVAINNSSYLLDHLRAEDLEFFMSDVRLIEAAEDLIITHECRQYGGIYCRPGHPLLERSDVTPTELLPYGMAAPTIPEVLMTQLNKLFRLPPGRDLPIVLSCDSIHTLVDVAAESDLLLLSSHAALAEAAELGRLKQLPVPLPPVYADIATIRLRGRTLSPGAQRVLQAARAILSQLAGTEMPRQ
ncbi:LysR family transcriptional regulator [Pseudoduganella sp. OTU4001]|uniref:LysR family transcriptional regulator n=1 Tax=Pseudoduganella sp. OTU4001 TaxID=3043854 RepID=UPI00313E51C2